MNDLDLLLVDGPGGEAAEGLLETDAALGAGEGGAEAEWAESPKLTWRYILWVTSKRSGSGVLPLVAAGTAGERATRDPVGTIVPCSSMSLVVNRPCPGEGTSYRSSSSTSLARWSGERPHWRTATGPPRTLRRWTCSARRQERL